jgi:spore germination protein GerM
VYFVEKDRLESTTLTLQRVLDSVEEALLVALFQGPHRGSTTEIPEGTRLNGVDVVGGVATVDVSGDFERAAPPRSQALRIAQVVYTLTDPANETGVQGISFQIDGVPQVAIGGAQLGAITGPVTRADYERFAPRERQPGS